MTTNNNIPAERRERLRLENAIEQLASKDKQIARLQTGLAVAMEEIKRLKAQQPTGIRAVDAALDRINLRFPGVSTTSPSLSRMARGLKMPVA